eukprot:249333-Alexandrium_andersonii.AAC.1
MWVRGLGLRTHRRHYLRGHADVWLGVEAAFGGLGARPRHHFGIHGEQMRGLRCNILMPCHTKWPPAHC